MGSLRVEGRCRGEGLGYVALAADEPLPADLHARAFTPAGTEVPCLLMRPADAPDTAILAMPLLSCKLELHVEGGGLAPCTLSFSPRGSKVSSRLLTHRNPRLAAALRGSETRQGLGAPHIQVTDIWPAGQGRTAWRVRAVLPLCDDRAPLETTVLDAQGKPVAAETVIMEDQLICGSDRATHERVVTLSLLVAEQHRHLCIAVRAGTEPGGSCFCCLLPYQAEALLERAHARISGPARDPRYPSWLAGHRAGTKTLAAQRSRAQELAETEPRFSILEPEGLSDAARQALDAQTYPCWELVRSLEDATGSHVVLVGAVDLLEPDALWCLRDTLAVQPDTDLLYADSDMLVDGQLQNPQLRPGPSYGRLLSQDYLGSLLAVRRATLETLPPLDAGAGDPLGYALALEGLAHGWTCTHVPRVLVHTEAEAPCPDGARTREVAANHLARRGIAATVEATPWPHVQRVRYQLSDPAPHVSIVIPSKDHHQLLETCVTSLLERTTYPSFDVTVVENNSCEPETFACYERLCADPRVRVVTWEPPAGAQATFNYSAIVNHGVRSCSGELVVLLNNDTEVISPDWLEELAGNFSRSEVGIVGAKLLFGDGLVQHAGLAANPNGDFLHPNQNLCADEPGYLCAAVASADVPMVTGACQMIRRSLYEELGGYDEQLAVGYNDGDFCLRAGEAGYATVFDPHALLHHREFSSRGREATDERLRERYLREKARFMSRHAAFLSAGDPIVNPALDPFSPWRELRL